MTEKAPAIMSAAEIMTFWDAEFAQIHEGGRHFSVTAASFGAASLRMGYAARFLRPGGSISGPSMFALADLAMYAAVLSAIGPVALAVTTSLNINFLRRAEPGALLAEARLLKLGKRLAVGEIGIFPEAGGEMAAHASATYSIPPSP